MFAVVSRQAVIDSRLTTVICAPVYSSRYGLRTEVAVGIDEGLKHDSALHCDALISVSKERLTAFVGALSSVKLRELDAALVAALDIDLEHVIE